MYNHQTHRKSIGSTLFIKGLKDPFNSPLICFLGEVMMVILRALYLKRFQRGKLPRASPTSHPLNLYHYFSLYYIFKIKNNINILLVLSGASYSSPMKEILGSHIHKCQTRKPFTRSAEYLFLRNCQGVISLNSYLSYQWQGCWKWTLLWQWQCLWNLKWWRLPKIHVCNEI